MNYNSWKGYRFSVQNKFYVRCLNFEAEKTDDPIIFVLQIGTLSQAIKQNTSKSF